MNVTSPVFKNNSAIPAKYTCDGLDINPPLDIRDVPRGTRSFALIVDDPDAPIGTWVHWVVWNIDASTTEISAESVPAGGVEGNTSFGKPGYGGPCPPSGTHRYFFKLYALDRVLDIPRSSDKNALELAMNGHILEKAELLGFYKRGK